MIKLLLRMLGLGPSVSSITERFSKTVAQLEELHSHCEAQEAKHEVKISRLTQRRDAHTREKAAALHIAAKIKALVSPEADHRWEKPTN